MFVLDPPIDKNFVHYCNAHECDLVCCASFEIFIQANKSSNRVWLHITKIILENLDSKWKYSKIETHAV